MPVTREELVIGVDDNEFRRVVAEELQSREGCRDRDMVNGVSEKGMPAKAYKGEQQSRVAHASNNSCKEALGTRKWTSRRPKRAVQHENKV